MTLWGLCKITQITAFLYIVLDIFNGSFRCLLSRDHSITRPPRAEAFILFMAVTSSSIVAVTSRPIALLFVCSCYNFLRRINISGIVRRLLDHANDLRTSK